MAAKSRTEPIISAGKFKVDSHGIARNELFTSYTNLLRIDILDHGYFFGDTAWNQFDIISPYSRLYFMTNYEGWLETEKGIVPLIPGNMYLIPPYYRVNLRTREKIEKFYFHFTTEFDGTEIFEGLRTCLTLPLEEELLSRFLDAFESVEIADLFRFKSAIYDTVARFIHTYMPDIKEKLMLASKNRDILHYIDQHLSATLSAKEVAEALGLSYVSMTRNYKNDTGITLNKYIRSRTIYKAIHLLLQTDRTVKSISEELGFVDEFYFSRFFKKHVDYSPREYRRVNKAGAPKIPRSEL